MNYSVIEYLNQTAADTPGKTALVDGAERIDFATLRVRADMLATQIVAHGCEPNAPVAIFLPKSADAFIAVCGILESGNCYVPLDVKSPEPRIRAILDSLAAPLVVSAPAWIPALERLGVPPERIVDITANEAATEGATNMLAARRARLIDADPAYIIFTSGSTGIPKGVVICHRSIIDYIEWARETYAIDQNENIASQAPFYFDNSTLDIYLCLSCGATFTVVPDQLYAFPVKLAQFLLEQKITFIFWVPSIMVNTANLKALDAVELPALRKILFAGEVMPNKHLNYWRARVPGAIFSNLYGPTEITVDCTYLIIDRPFSDDEPLPIGIPCRNSDIIILDENDRAITQSGTVGELCVRGSSLALGYWNDPEKTATAFTQNPLQKHYPERIYRTGDLVSLNDRGEIMFVGRKDTQIKHMGYRIELGEIETALLGIDGVTNGCILYNAAKKEIVAFFTSGRELDTAALRKALAACLPQYMLPRTAVRLDGFPLSANGKIDRLLLAKTHF